MKKRKGIWIFMSIIAIFIIVSGLLIRNWTTSNYSKLNFRFAVMLTLNRYLNPNLVTVKSINEIRSLSDKTDKWMSNNPIEFSNIRNIKIKVDSYEIPVRIYTPEGGSKLPIIIYSHGGSWIGGTLDSTENVCRKLSQNTKAIVISVDYRLAPENPFPAGLNDVYTVLEWTAKNAASINGDANHIAVVGDSAGGNISAAVSQMARDKKGPKISCQVLIYPSTNIYSLNSESWAYFTDDYIIPKVNMEKFISLYVPKKEDRKNPYVSPLLAKDFKGLPSTLIITSENDPLRDEGEAYGEKLKQAGINVVITRYKGVPHGFVTMDRLSSQGDKALNQISLYLQKMM